MDEPAGHVLRTAGDARQADEWALVLASAGIVARREPVPAGWALSVDPDQADAAAAVLAAYEAENRPAPAAAAPVEYGPSRAAIVAAALLAAFFVVTGPRQPGIAWFERGSADAARIAGGEVWRCVTALTLHADFLHVLSNAVALALFGSALCVLLGPGVALWLLLLAGAGGNLLDVLLRGAPHSSVGASTAVFGGVGALAALQVMRRRRAPSRSRRAWPPVAAGLALLAFLGTAPGTNVIAHGFGFAVGGVLGVAAGLRLHPASAPLQRMLLALAAVAVVAAWLLAFAAGSRGA